MAVEYPTLVSVLTTDTFEEWRKKTNSMISHTEAGKENIGDLGLLSTDDKFSIVNAINEVDAHVDANTQIIGNLSLLKSDISAVDLVSAINNNYDYQKKNTDDQIDKEVIDRKAADSAIQSELNLTQTSLGILSNGTFNTMVGSNYLSTATNLQGAVSLLDTTTKTKADLLDTLIATVGSDSTAEFDWTDSTVNYLVVELNGNANIKKNMVILDQRIKTNTDAQILNTTATEQNLTKINNVIGSLGTSSSSGVMVTDSRNTYAVESNVKNNIKLLDDNILLLNQKLDGEIDRKLDSLQDQIDLRSTLETQGDMSLIKTSSTTIVGAINDLYDMIKPLVDGDASTPFVLKTGDTMTGTLNINGGNLNVQGQVAGNDTSGQRTITCTGDIVAYYGSV